MSHQRPLPWTNEILIQSTSGVNIKYSKQYRYHFVAGTAQKPVVKHVQLVSPEHQCCSMVHDRPLGLQVDAAPFKMMLFHLGPQPTTPKPPQRAADPPAISPPSLISRNEPRLILRAPDLIIDADCIMTRVNAVFSLM